MEGTNIQIGGGRKLVLGFDAGCTACTNLAERIAGRVDGKLEVRSLYDPQVEHWRRQVLGDNAPWAPTLIEVKGGKVRAWTGARMGVALGLRLGPRDTWRVLQVLGELNYSRESTGASAEIKTSSGLSRGQFLKGVGGAAAAAVALTGSGKFTSSAFARSETSNGVAEALKSARKADVRGRELINAAREAAQRGDVANVMGRAWSDKVRNGRATTNAEDGQQTILLEGGQSSSRSDGRAPADAERIVIGAARHTLKDGTTLLIIAYRMLKNNKLLVYQEFDQAVPDGAGDLKSEATLHRVEDDELVLEQASSNGSLETSASSRSRCSGCSGAGGCRYRNRRCTRRSYRCFISSCGPCAIACGPGLALLKCIGCAVIACPYAWNFGCCRAVSYSSCRTCYRCF